MADMPPAGLPPTPAAPPTWTPTPPAPRRTAPRWPGFTALGIALVALVVAVAGWFRPPAPPPTDTAPTYSDQQVADAKARACEAFDLVDQGVVLQTGGGEQGGVSSEPVMAEAQAANARLSLIAGSAYLRDHVSSATPPDLAGGINHLADVLADLGVRYLAGEKDIDPELATLLADGEASFQQIEGFCK